MGEFNCWTAQQQNRHAAACLGWPGLRGGELPAEGPQAAAAAAAHASAAAQLSLGSM